MNLMELFYLNSDNASVDDDGDYEPKNDKVDVLDYGDTRKTKLTLKQINELRKTSEQHAKEVEKELEFIARMYVTPAAQ